MKPSSLLIIKAVKYHDKKYMEALERLLKNCRDAKTNVKPQILKRLEQIYKIVND